MNFEDYNFDIKEYIGKSSLEELNKIAMYLDYALVTTIKKQLPDIDLDDEKLYAKEVLKRYFKGDMHIFTSQNNIRNNIYTIGNEKLTEVFLKCMIEMQAYHVLIQKKDDRQSYREQCCHYITNRIAHNHYQDIIEWLNSDFDNIEEIINNYVEVFYKRKYDERLDFERLTAKDSETNEAMNHLNLEVMV